VAERSTAPLLPYEVEQLARVIWPEHKVPLSKNDGPISEEQWKKLAQLESEVPVVRNDDLRGSETLTIRHGEVSTGSTGRTRTCSSRSGSSMSWRTSEKRGV